LKLKSLAVITLFVLGCSFASAQTFGFASTNSGLYCNYEQINNTSVLGTDVWQGFDNLSPCGITHNATIAGFGGNLPTAAGLPVVGRGVIYGDNLYDAFSSIYTGEQWTVFTLLKCNKLNTHTGKFIGNFSWIGIASVSNFVFGDNFGFLSCTHPAAGDKSIERGTTAGKIANTGRK